MTNYYVRKTGNDSTGDGSTGNPWLTIQKAVDTISAAGGHTIYVGAGTYAENYSGNGYLNVARAFSAEVTIRPEAAAAVVITRASAGNWTVLFGALTTNVTFDGVNSGGASLSITPYNTSSVYTVFANNLAGINNIKFKNLTITNTASVGYGLAFMNGSYDNITLENVTITCAGATSACALFYGAAGDWAYNWNFTNCTMSGGQYCIKIHDSGRVDGLTVTGGNYSTGYSTACAIGLHNTSFTGIVKNVTFDGVTVRGIGNGVELGATSSAVALLNLTFTDCDIDTLADDRRAVQLGAYIDTLLVDGGEYRGKYYYDDGQGRGGLFIAGAGNADITIQNATFQGGEHGALSLGIEGADGVLVDNCTFEDIPGGVARGCTFQNNVYNATMQNCTAIVGQIGFRCGHDATTAYASGNIICRNNTLVSESGAAVVIGAGVDDVLVEGNILSGGDSVVRLRGAVGNNDIVLRNNSMRLNPDNAGSLVAAITLYGANEASIEKNRITGEWPVMVKAYVNGALNVGNAVIQNNTFVQYGSGTMFDLADAVVDSALVVNGNRYKIGSGGWGVVPSGAIAAKTMAALRAAWASYAQSSNDSKSTRLDVSASSVGTGNVLTTLP